MAGMAPINQSRLPWELHFMSWTWLVIIFLASLFTNMLLDPYGRRFGWPFWFAAYANPPVIWRDPLTFLPFGELRLLGNVLVCLFVLLMSTLTVERWSRRLFNSRFRFGLRGLLALTAWVAFCYVFFQPTTGAPLWHLVLYRLRDWLLLVLYLGIGLSTVAVIDIASKSIDAIFHPPHLRD